MKYISIYAKKFRKSIKKLIRSGDFDLKETEKVMQKLIDGQKLESKHRDHFLTGEYEGCKECHIKNDLLLIYEIDKEKMMITFINIGSHQELFG